MPHSPQSSEEAIWKAWTELDEKRKELRVAERCGGVDFTTKLLGGKWTRVHRGKAFDAMIGIGRGRAAPEPSDYGLGRDITPPFPNAPTSQYSSPVANKAARGAPAKYSMTASGLLLRPSLARLLFFAISDAVERLASEPGDGRSENCLGILPPSSPVVAAA